MASGGGPPNRRGYGQPGNQYGGQPGNQYGGQPGNQYGGPPPFRNILPQQGNPNAGGPYGQYNAPPPGYGGPPAGSPYGPRSSSPYGPPGAQYNAPPPGYGGQYSGPSYGSPYGPPSGSPYGATGGQYNAPPPGYGGPPSGSPYGGQYSSRYGAPTPPRQPSPQYGSRPTSPDPRYGAPQPSAYGAPQSGPRQQSPDPRYGAPQPYGAPQSGPRKQSPDPRYGAPQPQPSPYRAPLPQSPDPRYGAPQLDSQLSSNKFFQPGGHFANAPTGQPRGPPPPKGLADPPEPPHFRKANPSRPPFVRFRGPAPKGASAQGSPPGTQPAKEEIVPIKRAVAGANYDGGTVAQAADTKGMTTGAIAALGGKHLPIDTRGVDIGAWTYVLPASGVCSDGYYEHQELGSGLTARVLKIEDEGNGKFYALKEIHKQAVIKGDWFRYIARERKALEEMDHPFIIKLHNVWEEKKSYFFCLDYMKNGDLWEYWNKYRVLHIDCVRFITAEMFEALAYMRTKGWVHRDIKHDNVLVDDRFHIKLTDFGMAKKVGSAAGKHPGEVNMNSFSGTLRVIAPECIEKTPVTFSTDIWNTACVLFELWAGNPIFRWEDDVEDTTMIRRIKSLEIKYPTLPYLHNPVVKDLVQRMMMINPAHRLGHDDINKIKQHEFYKGVQWDTLYQQTAPVYRTACPDLVKEGPPTNWRDCLSPPPES